MKSKLSEEQIFYFSEGNDENVANTDQVVINGNSSLRCSTNQEPKATPNGTQDEPPVMKTADGNAAIRPSTTSSNKSSPSSNGVELETKSHSKIPQVVEQNNKMSADVVSSRFCVQNVNGSMNREVLTNDLQHESPKTEKVGRFLQQPAKDDISLA